MVKQKDLTFTGFMGIIFIIIGIIGFIVILTSFDYQTYNELKTDSYLLEDEEIQFQMLEEGLMSTWVVAIGILLINVAIGSVLMALGKIIRLLEDIKGDKQGKDGAD
ncbi:hypothetical protein [Virgibacillus proomii]|uniref:hypothetical protein n=1 Tax=Virgibacillus proomii TaxID=84407 RepID=UPI0009844C61|nr:hypothetical protein [Virgibacillus proomii]